LIKLFDLVAFPQFSPIESSHAADLLPLGQAEGGCQARGKVTCQCIPSIRAHRIRLELQTRNKKCSNN